MDVVLVNVRIVSQRATDELAGLGHGLDAGKAGSDHDKGEERLLDVGIVGHVGGLKAPDHMRT